MCKVWFSLTLGEISTPGKRIPIPESEKFLLLESGIGNPGLWNLEYSSRNPESH